MVATWNRRRDPLALAVTGEAQGWRTALERIVGAERLTTYSVRDRAELLDVVESGLVDAAVLDDEAERDIDVLQLLRLIRRRDLVFPVVVVTRRTDRFWMQDALELAAFSVVAKPLELEPMLRQVSRIMVYLDYILRHGADDK